MGALTSLGESERGGGNETPLPADTRMELIQSATAQTRRLNRLVGNLLDMTRVQAGAVRLNRGLTDVQELVGAVLVQLEDRTSGRQVEVEIPDDLPMVSMDAVLIGQTLVNLLDNAIKFSQPVTPVRIEIFLDQATLSFRVLDRGPGVGEDELTKIFDKFYRGSSGARSGGTGLGLSICRGIVEAHHGRIWAENRPGGGLVVTFTIPVDSSL
jgi:two-component system sensor histidine kinase KdpD